MASETGQATADLIRDLQADPAAFDLFQAVRLLLRHTGNVAGREFPANIRIRPDLGLDYPESDILAVAVDDDGNYEVTTTLLGLYGVSSPLPAFYNEDLLDEEYEDENATRGFLDVLHHHLFPLLYRAWLKHRFADNAIELQRSEYWELLFSLAGLKEAEFREALLSPHRLIRYLGLLLQHPRSGVALETIVQDMLAPIPVELVPCTPRWVQLPATQQLHLGENSQLGKNTVIGARVEDRMGRFQLRIGNISGAEYQELINDERRMRFVRSLIDFFLLQPLECELLFDITGESVLPARLGSDSWSRLGHDAWLRSADESPAVTVRMLL